ncbi:uncharacterized protein [Asterias amurensis]|uniref:uncharacterized protein isoform X2 n=1 Tax=Asterias amurensis TaxID=7602 RepID=UPI003AB4A37B
MQLNSSFHRNRMLPAEKCFAYWLLVTLLMVCLATNCDGGGCPPAPINCNGEGMGEMRWGKRSLSDHLRDAGSQMVRPRRKYPDSQSNPKYRFRELLRRFTRNADH